MAGSILVNDFREGTLQVVSNHFYKTFALFTIKKTIKPGYDRVKLQIYFLSRHSL
jgi:hypothetical protein